MCTRPYPDCQLYPEVDLSGRDPQESDMDSTPGSDASDGGQVHDKEEGLAGYFMPGNSSGQLNPSMTSGSIISNEEQFEDYGEGEDVDFTPSSPCPDDETRTNGYSDLGSSVPSSAGQTPQKIRHLYCSEPLDVYCSQCCKKVNLLNDLEARLKNLRANSPNRKISSTAFGRDSIDSCDVDITEKVSFLEKKVTELENDSLVSGDLKSKLKQENTQLVHRVHELEEQIKDQETRAEQVLEEELKRHREAYSKMERDKSTEIELLCNRVQQLEEENGEMKLNVCRLKSQTEKLDQDEMDLYRKMMDKLWQNRHEFQKEREAMQELIEDLRRELEHLQLFKLETECPGRGRARLLPSVMENHKLRDQNDDLNGQILSLSLYEAKN
ncbi:hypothetical protein JZ751_013267, partial [Albula glossodonta]